MFSVAGPVWQKSRRGAFQELKNIQASCITLTSHLSIFTRTTCLTDVNAFVMEERQKVWVWMKVRVEGVSQTGLRRLAKAAAIIEHIIVFVLIRSLNYIQQKDRTAQQGRCCYHLDHVKELCLPIVSKLPFNRESCDSGSIASIGHDCCPSAVFTEGAQRRVWTTLNPLKYEQTHCIPWKPGGNL